MDLLLEKRKQLETLVSNKQRDKRVKEEEGNKENKPSTNEGITNL